MVFTFTNLYVMMYSVKIGYSSKITHKFFCYRAQKRSFYRFQFCIFNQPNQNHGGVGFKYKDGRKRLQRLFTKSLPMRFPRLPSKIHSTEVTTKWLKKFSL